MGRTIDLRGCCGEGDGGAKAAGKLLSIGGGIPVNFDHNLNLSNKFNCVVSLTTEDGATVTARIIKDTNNRVVVVKNGAYINAYCYVMGK